MPVNDILKQLNEGELAYRLPSSYNIDNNIISAIMDSVTLELNELFKAIRDTEKVKDIDFIFGRSLDYYGDDYEEYRQGDNDIDYLNRIKSLMLAYGSLGDQDTIIRGLAGYFGFPESLLQINNAGTRKIEIVYPTELNEDNMEKILLRLKAAGIRYELTKDQYWEDFTYEQLEEKTYEELEKLRYERGELNARGIYKISSTLDSK